MINRILMELYDDYESGNVDSLIEFTQKTLPNDGTDKLFVGCAIIMFTHTNHFKGRYDCTRENLLEIVKSAKEKIGNTNLLAFYIDRINEKKGAHKYLDKVITDDDLDKYADTIINYLEQFKPKFIDDIKKYEDKIDDYIKNNSNEVI